jgi:hypothetical protein
MEELNPQGTIIIREPLPSSGSVTDYTYTEQIIEEITEENT